MLNVKTVGIAALILTIHSAPVLAYGRGHGYDRDWNWGHNHNSGYVYGGHSKVVVRVLPVGYRTVVVSDIPYYVYQDTYYVTGPGGYVVTTPPPAIPPTTVMETVEEKKPIDSYEIHIPNANGSYTLVIIKKTEKGFIGPQGEFYPEHPTVEQLKAMYAK